MCCPDTLVDDAVRQHRLGRLAANKLLDVSVVIFQCLITASLCQKQFCTAFHVAVFYPVMLALHKIKEIVYSQGHTLHFEKTNLIILNGPYKDGIYLLPLSQGCGCHASARILIGFFFFLLGKERRRLVSLIG